MARKRANAKSMIDFFGRDGICARLFANTLEQMMEDSFTDHLDYAQHNAKRRNSGNSWNGYYIERTGLPKGTLPSVVGSQRRA